MRCPGFAVDRRRARLGLLLAGPVVLRTMRESRLDDSEDEDCQEKNPCWREVDPARSLRFAPEGRRSAP